MFPIFFTHSSVDRRPGCFRALAIVNSAAMNIGAHVCFWITVFSGYMSRSGAIAGSYGRLIQLLWRTPWMFLHNLKIDQTYGPLLMRRKETVLLNSTGRAFIFPMSHYTIKSFSNFHVSFILYSNKNHYFAICKRSRREWSENWDNFSWRQNPWCMTAVLKYHAENSHFHILKSCCNRKPG